MNRIFSLLLIALQLNSLITRAQNDSTHVLYFIGDTGEPVIETSPLGEVLRTMVSQESGPVTVVFLGDNVYPKGMPHRDAKGRSEAEKILDTQAGWLRGLQAEGIFIPGNHDWQKGHKNGWQQILNQQGFIDSLKMDNVTLLPRDGCPGPEEIDLNGNAVMVIIDSQWILHPWDKPEEESGCECKTLAELTAALSDVYARHAGKRIILVAHHPLISYGEHGGFFTVKDHLFPHTKLKEPLYLPLPGIGSIYPLYRKWFGNIQDTSHPLYRVYSHTLRKIMAANPGSIHVAGHEHALEYIIRDSSYFIVSGSGSKATPVKQKGYAQYAEPVNGFVRLALSGEGATEIKFWRVDSSNPKGIVVFQDTLSAISSDRAAEQSQTSSIKDAFVTVSASAQYDASSWRRRMLGANYRDVWRQDVTAPVFDIGFEKGGLRILQKGGGMQTLSLRLADSTGKEYTLRSVEKYPEAAVPEVLRKTFAHDLVQDQISAAHPYAALVIPPLAEAAGIYHTNPKLVFIPDDARLGLYRKTFANTLGIFEERPAGDWSESDFFGNSKKIINTSKVIEKLHSDNDNFVNEEFVLKARLFDLWIGDWDRHDDQWRWASFKKKKGEEYRPIPRDRDQVFFVSEGVLPKLWSRKWAMPKLEGFNDKIRWASGLSFNARYFDRTFLNGLTKEAWVMQARELQAAMTDEVIEEAIRSWPEEIFKLHGDAIVRKLKSRRESLVEDAESHYKFLSREVDVAGSNKHELFEVHRLPSGDVEVQVFKIDKKGEKDRRMFNRIFYRHETKEIRLYGLDGDDRFHITGSSENGGILVRVIGGDGTDVLEDQSHVSGPSRKTWFYDQKSSSYISAGEVRNLTSEDPGVNHYDRRAFQYNLLAPLLYGNFNVDDGFFIGGGAMYQSHGFRKTPFKQRHIAVMSFAPRTNSYNLLYRGDFIEVLGKWNMEFNADIKAPNFVNNFFGWGNESVFDRSINKRPDINANRAIDYYRFRFEEVKVEALLSRTLGSVASFRIGPQFQRISFEQREDNDRFIYDYASTLSYDLFSSGRIFSGLRWGLQVDKRDNRIVTRRGVVMNITGRSMAGMDELSDNFSAFEGDVSFYHTFQYPGRLTFAVRAGGGVNTGRYEFFQAQILDGKNELRGFRKTRFYGDSKFYSNLEARLRLFSFRTYLFPASMGILGFHDIGRVWYKDDSGTDPSALDGESNVWHKTWGGGIWFTPFNMTVLSAELGHSQDGNLFYLRLGFLF